MKMETKSRVWVTLALAAVLVPAGCRKPGAVVDDPTLTANVQQRIQGDAAISSEPIQVATVGGVVTLNGQVSNDAVRTLAARDAAAVAGVKTVVNDITVAANTPPAAALTQPALPSVAAAPPRERAEARKPSAAKPVPIQREQPVPQSEPPRQQAVQQTPVAPPVPAGPVYRNVTLPSGSILPVRITQTLDSASTQTGQTFSGSIATDVVQDGLVVLARGTGVSGRVTDAKDATHFTGSSHLAIELTSIDRRGQSIPVSTATFEKQGAARGKNTAVKTGVGAAAGAVLGGIFGGGKGAAIGAAAGGGTGAGVNAVTRGQQVQIPSETVVRFETTSSISVRVRTDATASSDSSLNPRQGSY